MLRACKLSPFDHLPSTSHSPTKRSRGASLLSAEGLSSARACVLGTSRATRIRIRQIDAIAILLLPSRLQSSPVLFCDVADDQADRRTGQHDLPEIPPMLGRVVLEQDHAKC